MKNIIMDFGLYYEIAKKKIKLKLWSAEYSKGYLYFFSEQCRRCDGRTV